MERPELHLPLSKRIDAMVGRALETVGLAGMARLCPATLTDWSVDAENLEATIRTLERRVADLEKRAADEGAGLMLFEHHGEAMLVDPATGKRRGWYRDAETALEVHRLHEAAREAKP